ncbi:N-acetylmuramoyl-L-alanine amidase [Aeribacillus sp. FSL K6-8394]|uniref:N-acetylmuramoyl-L-alanine amidase n=1 Tax=Aeribacillus sp. FSL K6-8394 TaxID=2954570 RepID=UPI0030FB707D
MAIKIRKNFVPSDKYSIKCPYKMSAEYITVHNTANDASAANEVAYMIRNNNQVSYHFAVDDKEAVQAIPLDRNAWHAGDGGNGTGNRKSIGIEICYSKSGGDRYKKAEANAIKLIAQLLRERGWGVDRVKKHQDWSGKYCPHRILAEGRWQSFLNAVNAELNGEKYVDIPKPTKHTKPTGNATISEIQATLNKRYGFGITVDGKYGPQTKKALIKAFQTELNRQFRAGLVVDGIYGPKTEAATVTVRRGASGNITWILQAALYCNGHDPKGIDGKFGSNTEKAVRSFQRAKKITVDGVAGKQTFAKLFK